MFLWMAKSFEFIVRNSVCEAFAGCVRERTRYQKTLKRMQQSNLKINGKSMKIHARKNNAKNIEHIGKKSQKGANNRRNNIQIEAKNKADNKCIQMTPGPRIGRWNPFLFSNK